MFEEKGHNVIYLNTSKEDLDTLIDAKHTHHIKNGEGCNKDRDKAKNLIVEDFDDILQQIDEKLKEEFIFVIFSSGGGTGSGASPMLIDLLIQRTQKKVGAITILPSKAELLKAYINSYECFKELEEIEGLGATFVLDNNRDDKITVNQRFVGLFSAFIGIPGHNDIRGNIDRAEIKELLSTRGASTITKMDRNTSSTAKLIRQMQNGVFAPLEPDRVIKYIGLSATEQVDLEAIYKETGVPLDIYQGTNSRHTVCMLCGLTYPYTSLEDMRQKIEENKEGIMRNLGATETKRLTGDINFLASSQPAQTVSDETNTTKADPKAIFAKYMRK